MTRAVIFDMDGVLIDSEGIYLEHIWNFAKSKNSAVKLQELYNTVGSSKKDTWSVIAKAVSNGQLWSDLMTEYQDSFPSPSINYRTIYRTEATALLNSLEEKGYLLALASSSPYDVIKKVLNDNQINKYFKVIVSGNQFVRSKPDPEIYHYTAAQLQVTESECFVIEDSTFGILAATRAGMKTAALIDNRFGFDQSLADIYLENISDMVRYLD